jgi:hypothetical protein
LRENGQFALFAPRRTVCSGAKLYLRALLGYADSEAARDLVELATHHPFTGAVRCACCFHGKSSTIQHRYNALKRTVFRRFTYADVARLTLSPLRSAPMSHDLYCVGTSLTVPGRRGTR